MKDAPSTFGFVTACHPGDHHLVTATLASIRRYCPGVPICLLADGPVDVSALQKTYDLIVIQTQDLPDPELRALVSGNYRVKQLAMWHGPFDHYVWIDSDAIVWGDLIPHVRFDLDFQIFWPGISIDPTETTPPAWLDHFYFNLEALSRYDPDFEWRGHPYFSAGVYACKRNVFTYERWLELEAWQAMESGKLFRFGDQGMLNYLVHSAKQRGEIRCDHADLQHTRGMNGTAELVKDCENSGWSFPSHIARPRIVHFCGQKPHVFNHRGYSKPFTIARIAHQRMEKSIAAAWSVILLEDIKAYWLRAVARLRGRFGIFH